MARSPEEQRRESAEQQVPEGAGGGQMGRQKAGMGQPPATREERQGSRDAKPDTPPDPGGRVREQSSGHRGALRPKDVVPPTGGDEST